MRLRIRCSATYKCRPWANQAVSLTKMTQSERANRSHSGSHTHAYFIPNSWELFGNFTRTQIQYCNRKEPWLFWQEGVVFSAVRDVSSRHIGSWVFVSVFRWSTAERTGGPIYIYIYYNSIYKFTLLSKIYHMFVIEIYLKKYLCI